MGSLPISLVDERNFLIGIYSLQQLPNASSKRGIERNVLPKEWVYIEQPRSSLDSHYRRLFWVRSDDVGVTKINTCNRRTTINALHRPAIS